MNAAEKAEALASIRQDLGGLGLGLVLGAVACYFVRPKTKATNALEMAQRWLAWGLLGSVSSGVSFWVRNYDKGGIVGGLITILFFSGLAWGLGYVWGLIKFAAASTQRPVSTTPTALGPKSLSSMAIMGFIGAAILALVAVSGIKDIWTTPKPKNWWEEPGAVEKVHKKLGIAPAPNVSLDELAAQGNAFAQLQLGRYYFNGEGGKPKDPQQAVEWIRKAAMQGHPDAQALLGVRYMKGEGVEKDEAKGEEWLLKAAEQGHRLSQARLGFTYLIKEPFTASLTNPVTAVGLDSANERDKKAVFWLEKAAEQGEIPCQIQLAKMYKAGRGVARDAETAFKWFMSAAQLGDTEAKREVGLALFEGGGTSQNQKEGVKWLLEAAIEGDTVAPRILGLAYKNGDGVTKDTKAALAWLYVANSSSDDMTDNAKVIVNEKIAELEGVLGRDGTLESQELAKTLIPPNPPAAATN